VVIRGHDWFFVLECEKVRPEGTLLELRRVGKRQRARVDGGLFSDLGCPESRGKGESNRQFASLKAGIIRAVGESVKDFLRRVLRCAPRRYVMTVGLVVEIFEEHRCNILFLCWAG
jgi:hypothetical protein